MYSIFTENKCAHCAQPCYSWFMELRITKFDAALHKSLKMQAAKQGKSLRQVVIELLRESIKATK